MVGLLTWIPSKKSSQADHCAGSSLNLLCTILGAEDRNQSNAFATPSLTGLNVHRCLKSVPRASGSLVSLALSPLWACCLEGQPSCAVSGLT